MTAGRDAPIRDVAVALPVRSGRVLVGRRAEAGHLDGLWEFPGGKLHAGEDPAAAARRELGEETGLDAPRLEPLIVVEHHYADRSVRLHCFIADEPEGEVDPGDGREWAWVDPHDLDPETMPSANASILRALDARRR